MTKLPRYIHTHIERERERETGCRKISAGALGWLLGRPRRYLRRSHTILSLTANRQKDAAEVGNDERRLIVIHFIITARGIRKYRRRAVHVFIVVDIRDGIKMSLK